MVNKARCPDHYEPPDEDDVGDTINIIPGVIINTREGDYEKIIDELWQGRAEARKEYIAGIFIMRENMTREEWNAAFDPGE